MNHFIFHLYRVMNRLGLNTFQLQMTDLLLAVHAPEILNPCDSGLQKFLILYTL